MLADGCEIPLSGRDNSTPPPPKFARFAGRGTEAVGRSLRRFARRLTPAPLAAVVLLALGAAEAQAQAPVLTAQAGDRSVTLTWTWSGTRTSHSKWSYGQRNTGSGPSFPRTAIPGSTVSTRSYTITGLDNGTSYDFHVVGTTGGGIGLSGTLSNTVSATPNAPPVLISDPDKTVRVGSQGTVQVCYNLLSVSYAGTTYLEKRNGETAVAAQPALKDTTNGVSITEAPAVIRNLVVGTGSVNFDPCATVGEGVHRVTWEWNGPNGAAPKGTTSTTFTVLVAENTPAKPTGLDTVVANSAVLLHWDDPDDATITGYKVLAGKTSERDSATWTLISGSDADTTTHTVGSLVNDAEYSFKIRAVNVNGDGTATDWVKATPSETCPPTDGPSAVSVTPGLNQLALTWTKSIRIFRTGWQVQYRETGTTGDWTVKTISDANANSYTITGLEAETGYDLRVTGVYTFPPGSICPPGGTTTATGTTTAPLTGKNIAISVASATIAEGNTGKTDVTINYTLGESPSSPIDFDIEVVAASTTATDNTNIGTTSCTAPSSNADVCYFRTGSWPNNKRFEAPAFATSGSFKIGILGDTKDEPNETFAFRVTADSFAQSEGWTRSSNTITLTITDDDEPTPGVTVTGSPLTVAEGGTQTYTVKLDTSPSATVTVTPTSSDTGAATVSPASHTFNSGDYGTPKTFTVTGEQDENADDETATITHAVTGGDYASVTADSVRVTVTDDEEHTVLTPTLTTAANSSTNGEIDLTWTHGGGSTPEKYMSGSVSSNPAAIYWQAHHRLKGAGSWTLWSNISVAEGRARRTLSIPLSSTYPDGASVEFRVRAAATDTSVGGTITGPWSNIRTVAAYANTQLAALTLVGAPVTVAPGSTKTYTVALTKAFAGTLRITSDDTDKATVEPATLTFTTGNYNTAQTVTVTGVEAGSATINHAFRLTGASADAISDAGTVEVTVATPIVAPVLATAASTTSGRINLTWTHAGSAVGDLVSGAANFSGWQAQTRLKGGSWSNEPVQPSSSRTNIATRSARVQPGDDYPGGAVVQVRIRARGYVTGTSGTQTNGPWSNARDVTYKNDALAALTLVGAPVTVTAGSTATYTAALTKAFAGTLTLSSADTDTATVSPETLTFTTANYNTAQTVTVSGAKAGTTTINHSFRLTGATADAIPDAGTADVTVEAETVEKPAAPTGLTATAGNAQVTLTWDDPDDDSITGYEYQRKKGAGSAAWSAWAPLDGSDGDTTTHTFTNLDNDVVHRYRLRAVNAGGSGAHAAAKATPVGAKKPQLTATAGDGQVTLSWNPQPGRGITAWVYEYRIGSGAWTSATVSDGAATSAVVGSLTNGTEYTFRLFARAGSAQSVWSDHVKATPSSSAGAAKTISVPATLTVAEGAGNATIAITASAALGSAKTFDVAYGGSATGAANPADGDYDNDAATSVAFSASQTTRNIVIPITDDARDEGNETFTVTISARGGVPSGFVLSRSTTTVTITDDDASPALADIADVTIRLGQEVNIVASATDADGDSITYAWERKTGETAPAIPQGTNLSRARLRFTPLSTGSYTMKVIARDGNGNSDSEEVVIRVAAKTLVSVPATLSVAEGAGTASVAITAGAAFGRAVTFNVTYRDAGATGAANPADGDYDNDAVTSVSFSASDTSKTIAIPITDDSTAEGAESFTVTIAPSAALPAGYGLGNATTTVTITDNDGGGGGGGGGGGSSPSPSTPSAGVTLSLGALQTPAGGSGSYTLVLDRQPSGDVTVTVSIVRAQGYGMAEAVSAGGVTVDPSSLTFTRANWDAPQSVRVRVAEDAPSGRVTLRHRASGGGYDDVEIGAVSLRIQGKPAGLRVSETELSVDEGGSGSYTLVLQSQPTGDVKVAVSGASGDISIAPASLTFTPANWRTPQTVRVSAGEDADAVPDMATLTHRASGGGYDQAEPVRVAVRVVENDEAGVTVAPTELEIDEDGSGSYTVVLLSEPTGPVTVTPSSSDPGAASVSGALSFTAANWSEPQMVTVSGVEDPNSLADMSATVRHRVSGGDYGAVQADSVSVTVRNVTSAAEIGRANRLNEVILPQFAAAFASQATGAVADRIESVAAGQAMDGLQLGTPMGATGDAQHFRHESGLFREEERLATGQPLRLGEALNGAAFQMTLGSEDAEEGLWSSVGVWGRGGLLSLGGADREVSFDGDLWSAHLGADARIGTNLLAGLVLSRAGGDFDATSMETGGTEGAVAGAYEAGLTSAHPYVAWFAPDGSNLWASGGYGRGEVRIAEEGAGARRSAGMGFASGAVGGRGALLENADWLSGGTTRLAVKGEGSYARLATAAEGGLTGLTMHLSRLRLLLEGSHERALWGGTLTPSLEAGARYDRGDAVEGAGLEVGGGARYRALGSRLSVELRGRGLLAHAADRREWGFGATVSLEPDAAGRGAFLKVEPSQGESASGVAQLFDRSPSSSMMMAAGPGSGVVAERRLTAEGGHGFGLDGGATLTPYAGLAVAERGRQLRLGARYRLAGDGFRLGLEGMRRESAALFGGSGMIRAHSLALEGTLSW